MRRNRMPVGTLGSRPWVAAATLSSSSGCKASSRARTSPHPAPRPFEKTISRAYFLKNLASVAEIAAKPMAEKTSSRPGAAIANKPETSNP